jgi:hypothetical protein
LFWRTWAISSAKVVAGKSGRAMKIEAVWVSMPIGWKAVLVS